MSDVTPATRLEDAEALFLLGSRRLGTRDWAGAEACFRETLLLNPTHVEARANLALVLDKQGALAEAETCYRQAIDTNPNLAACLSNFGNFLAGRKRFDEAEQRHRQALALAPTSPIAWTNLGVLYAALQRRTEAEACHRRALSLSPDYATARFNLSYLLLQQGRFEEGWPMFESRDWYEGLARQIPCPRWQGESLTGKSLLIGFEAGHGDMIQFCRYIPQLKARGARRIDLICHPPLASLFRTIEGVDRLIPFDQALPDEKWDCWTPLMSLPYYFGTRVETIPAPIPYLHADPERVAQWKALIPTDGLRVGLVWQGNPQYENDADRSLPSLTLLEPLCDVKGVRFVSLQKGHGEAEAKQLADAWNLIDLGSRVTDFADTAAIVTQLDLVISVDTGVGHLAGALGKPCWLLLPDYMTDWRWLTDRADSPWYPGTHRLFRQSASRSWPETIALIKPALESLAGKA